MDRLIRLLVATLLAALVVLVAFGCVYIETLNRVTADLPHGGARNGEDPPDKSRRQCSRPAHGADQGRVLRHPERGDPQQEFRRRQLAGG